VTSAGAVSVARALRAVASIYLPASAQGLRLICPVGSQSCARTSVPSKGIRSLFLKRTVNSMIIRPICTISDTVGVESRSSGTQ